MSRGNEYSRILHRISLTQSRKVRTLLRVGAPIFQQFGVFFCKKFLGHMSSKSMEEILENFGVNCVDIGGSFSNRGI